LRVPLFGLDTIDHTLPFHDSISVRSSELPFRYRPIAMHEVPDTHETSLSSLKPVPLFGLDTIDHTLPFHDSISV
jgi:hypothetical protein